MRRMKSERKKKKLKLNEKKLIYIIHLSREGKRGEIENT